MVRPLTASGLAGVSLSWIDRSHASSSTCSSGHPSATAAVRRSPCTDRTFYVSPRSPDRALAELVGVAQPGRALRGCGYVSFGVALPADHHLPRDARDLVGQRNGGKLRRLAL